MDKTPSFSGKSRPSLVRSNGHSLKRLVLFTVFSILAHVVFFVSVLLFYHFEMPKPLPKVVQVDLVSFVPGPVGGKEDVLAEPAENPDPPAPETGEVPELVSVPQERPETPDTEPAESLPPAVIKPDISLKKKPKNLKDLMAEQENKKPLKPKPVSKKKPKREPAPARKKQEKKENSQDSARIAKALDRMKQAVAQQGANKSPKGGGQNLGQGEGSGTGLGRKGYDPIDLYKTVLKVAIQKNWVFNTAMARMDQDLEVTIFLKILKSGEIRDIIFETRSGNQYLDDSAKKAIQRSNPLPALPKGMASWDVLVIFTPKGLK